MCSTSATPLGGLDLEWRLSSTYEHRTPCVVWCTPETPNEDAYVARWGVRDWPADHVDLFALDDDGRLWLRADRLDELDLDAVLAAIAATN